MTVPDGIVVRDAAPADVAAISALVVGLTQRWIAGDCTAEGAAKLLDSMAEGPTAERLRDGHRYVVAERSGEIVGVAALRLPSHLYHLFVREDAQRCGIARRLWETVRAHADPAAPVTVNASRHALEVYRRLGFQAVGEEDRERGIPSTPMVWRPPA